MIYAQFYQMSTGYIPGTIPPQFGEPQLIEVSGERTGDALYSFNDAIDAGLSEWIKDLEDQESDEYIADFLTADEYQFLENGRML